MKSKFDLLYEDILKDVCGSKRCETLEDLLEDIADSRAILPEAAGGEEFAKKCKAAWNKIAGAATLLGRVSNLSSLKEEIYPKLGIDGTPNSAIVADFVERIDVPEDRAGRANTRMDANTFPPIFKVDGQGLQKFFEEKYLKDAKTDLDKITAYVRCARDLKAFNKFYLPLVSMTRNQVRMDVNAGKHDIELNDRFSVDEREEKEKIYFKVLKQAPQFKEIDTRINNQGQIIGLCKNYINDGALNMKSKDRSYPFAIVMFDSKLDGKVDSAYVIRENELADPTDVKQVSDKIGTAVASVINPDAITDISK